MSGREAGQTVEKAGRCRWMTGTNGGAGEVKMEGKGGRSPSAKMLVRRSEQGRAKERGKLGGRIIVSLTARGLGGDNERSESVIVDSFSVDWEGAGSVLLKRLRSSRGRDPERKIVVGALLELK